MEQRKKQRKNHTCVHGTKEKCVAFRESSAVKQVGVLHIAPFILKMNQFLSLVEETSKPLGNLPVAIVFLLAVGDYN
jgi:hypothetical protein